MSADPLLRIGSGTLRRRQLLAASPALLGSGQGLGAEPPPLQLVSSHLPPFAIEVQGERRGALVEIAEAVLARAGWSQRVQFYPWARAILMASRTPRVLVLPLTRTPEREAQFQWLLRIYVQHFAFMVPAGQDPVQSLEQARMLRVGVLRGSPHRARLRHHGLSDAQTREAASVDDLHRMLELGMVDAIYGSTAINSRQARDSGRRPDWLRTGLVLESGDIWLAASGGISDAELHRMQEAHAALSADGTIARILRLYEL